MSTKICFKCKVEKPIIDFYKHSKMSDGHVNKCKTCNKNDIHKNYEDNVKKEGWIEKEQKRGREKYHRLNYKETRKIEDYKEIYEKITKKHRKQFPEKYKAHNKLAYEVKSGKILILINNHAHHWSYNEEHYYDIIILTEKEHNKVHRFLIYDQERFMYRRSDTYELLDGKEKHKSFIDFVLTTKED